MKKHIITTTALLFSVLTVWAEFDEIDLGTNDDAADAASSRPLVSAGDQASGIIDVSCDDTTLSDVLRQFRQITKQNIISTDSTNLQRRVSVQLKQVPWLDALQSILNSRGFRVEQRNNIYYVEESVERTFTRSYVLNNASAEELADLFNGYALKTENVVDKDGHSESSVKAMESKFSALTGKVHASAFPNANMLVLSGLESDLAECEKIIKSIDNAASQVYIEARFMELSSEAKHELGVKWDSMAKVGLTSGGNTLNNSVAANRNTTLRDLFKDLGDTSTTYDGTYSGTLTATDFSLFLSAFEQIGGTQIFSNPKVIISNGKEAVIDMTTKFPNVRVSANTLGGTINSGIQLTAEIDEIKGDKEKGLFAGSVFFSWGISLSVKPRISHDGLISVKIKPSISENEGFYEIATTGDTSTDMTPIGKYPIIKMKSITTDFTMYDGCTAVIGGLSRTEEEDVDNGIPLLRSIPWIGPRIFGWKSREKVQKEIIICVTIGIANPMQMPKDVGLPKNAVLGREYVEGRRLEPGDRPNAAQDLHKFDTRTIEEMDKTPYPNKNKAKAYRSTTTSSTTTTSVETKSTSVSSSASSAPVQADDGGSVSTSKKARRH